MSNLDKNKNAAVIFQDESVIDSYLDNFEGSISDLEYH